MPCRRDALNAAIEGYERTGVPLVSYNSYCEASPEQAIDGLSPAGLSDDIGAYYFIPKLVEFFGISLDSAIALMYSGSVIIAFIVGSIASVLYCETPIGKIASVIGLGLLSFIIAGIGDSYIYTGAIPLALIPCWLYLQKLNNSKCIIPYFLMAGLIIAFGHLVRSHSGTATLIFICLSLFFFSEHYSNKLKFLSFLSLVGAMFFVSISFDTVIQHRAEFLTAAGSSLVELSGFKVFWHNFYYSLGYLWNNFGYANWPGHEPSDTYALTKALSVNPDVVLYSREYENILKQAFFEFVKEHPLFFIQTIFTKFGVLLMYVLLFANIGLVLSMYYPQGIKFNLLFAIGIGFNMMFGLLATPYHVYLMGLFTFSTLFGLYSIDHAIKIKFANDD